jgi:hypothetical protein
MTLRPDWIFHMEYQPKSNSFDLVERIKLGVEAAKEKDIDLCFIIENDDYYPANYFERFQPYFNDYHFFGQDYSLYYNLKNLTHNTFNHSFRASLFTTGFKISALNNFEWPDNNNPFLDIEIWRYARHKRRKFIDTGAIGIKHGLGLCGGKGHNQYWPKNYDKGMKYLQKIVDAESFNFYRSMSEKLNFVLQIG